MSALSMAGLLQHYPEETSNRMMVSHGSSQLLRAMRGEPECSLKRPRTYVRKDERRTIQMPDEARRILEDVATAFNVTVEEIRGAARPRVLVLARSVACRLMRDRDRFGNYSTTRIGQFMDRDHSTVCNALNKFETWAKFYPEVGEIYRRLGGVS